MNDLFIDKDHPASVRVDSYYVDHVSWYWSGILSVQFMYFVTCTFHIPLCSIYVYWYIRWIWRQWSWWYWWKLIKWGCCSSYNQKLKADNKIWFTKTMIIHVKYIMIYVTLLFIMFIWFEYFIFISIFTFKKKNSFEDCRNVSFHS